MSLSFFTKLTVRGTRTNFRRLLPASPLYVALYQILTLKWVLSVSKRSYAKATPNKRIKNHSETQCVCILRKALKINEREKSNNQQRIHLPSHQNFLSHNRWKSHDWPLSSYFSKDSILERISSLFSIFHKTKIKWLPLQEYFNFSDDKFE